MGRINGLPFTLSSPSDHPFKNHQIENHLLYNMQLYQNEMLVQSSFQRSPGWEPLLLLKYCSNMTTLRKKEKQIRDKNR